MSSRFVSGGTTDTRTGETLPADPSTSTSTAPTAAGGGGSSSSAKRSEEWAAVQAQVEEDRRRRQQLRDEAASRGGEGEKSLYDVLQANKAAKQAAFEEANKIKNQFRPLDDDEVEFLDGVRERKRAEEERLRRETEEGLKGFRELQSKISSGEAAAGGEGAVEGGGWSVGRKRKRRKDEPEGLIKGLKRRNSAAADGPEAGKAAEKGRDGDAGEETEQKDSTSATKDVQDSQDSKAKSAVQAAAKPKIGLVDYGSDDESD